MTEPTNQTNKRIEYIDALRGFTMILVVIHHVEFFCFGINSSFINDLFMSFRMPLFFFLSGFISYQPDIEWNKHIWTKMSSKKLQVQIIPTFIIGGIYVYLYMHQDFVSALLQIKKCGYWFTIVLCEMFLILYTTSYALYKIKTRSTKRNNLKIIVALATLSCIFMILRFAPGYYPVLISPFDILCIPLISSYFPYFAFGCICSINKDLFFKVLDNKYLTTVTILSFVLLFYISYVECFSSTIINYQIKGLLGFVGILVVYNTFRIYSDIFSSLTKVGRILQNVGRKTLDIYLIHYFFLPSIPVLGTFFTNDKNVIIELSSAFVISIIIICFCLGVSYLLRCSPILAKYLFGAKV